MSGPRILIVDDEAPLREVLSDLFDLEGYQVEVCGDATTAREKLAQVEFDVALVDVFLTDEPVGIALGKHILSVHPTISLVLMTGFADESDIRSGILSGAHTCIRKPFALDDVLRVISIAMDSQARERAA